MEVELDAALRSVLNIVQHVTVFAPIDSDKVLAKGTPGVVATPAARALLGMSHGEDGPVESSTSEVSSIIAEEALRGVSASLRA